MSRHVHTCVQDDACAAAPMEDAATATATASVKVESAADVDVMMGDLEDADADGE